MRTHHGSVKTTSGSVARRPVAVLASALMVGAAFVGLGVLATAIPASALPGPTILAGTDRIATAIATSQDSFTPGSATALVLATSVTFPDALVGTPLAVAVGGPLLLTDGTQSSVDSRTLAEIQRVLVPTGTIYILGGTSAISAGISTQLSTVLSSSTVTRLSGPDRFSTATAVAASSPLASRTSIIVANGIDFPDAVVAGVAAAESSSVVLLTNGTAPDPTTTAYINIPGNSVLVAIGGPAHSAYPSAASLVGSDRYDTSAKVANMFAPPTPGPTAYGVATGLAFPDALTGGVHIGAKLGPMLLIDPTMTTLPPTVQSYLVSVKPTLTSGYVYGGPSAVPNVIVGDLHAL